jgi:DNA anti-recombination protein RmuC
LASCDEEIRLLRTVLDDSAAAVDEIVAARNRIAADAASAQKQLRIDHEAQLQLLRANYEGQLSELRASLRQQATELEVYGEQHTCLQRDHEQRLLQLQSEHSKHTAELESDAQSQIVMLTEQLNSISTKYDALASTDAETVLHRAARLPGHYRARARERHSCAQRCRE